MEVFVLYVSILVLLKVHKQLETDISVSGEARNLLFPLETAASEQIEIFTFSL